MPSKNRSPFPTRLKLARRRKSLTQQQVADVLRVSVQAVSQWESGQSMPALMRAMRLADLLDVDWNWLEGAGPEQPIPSRLPGDNSALAVPPNTATLMSRALAGEWITVCPSLDVEPEVFVKDIQVHEGNFHRELIADSFQASLIYPTARPVGITFALEIERESMIPEFQIGDHVVIDTGVAALPGDYVAAKVEGDKRISFRKYRPRGIDVEGQEQFELAPLNQDYATIFANTRNPVRIIGTMVEHRRYRRQR